MSLRFAVRLAALALGLVSASLTAHASAAPPYDAIIVFGDSYNDVGNVAAIASQFGVAYPPAPYYNGRFSNGRIWVEDVASSLHLPLTPSVLGGTDWAEGGAELLQAVTLQGLSIPSVEDQVGEYLLSTGGKADPLALYVIEGGGNDILDATSLDPTLGSQIAAGLNGIVKTLAAAGAKTFLVPDVIDVGELPAGRAAGPEAAAFATATAKEINHKLVSSPNVAPIHGLRIVRVANFAVFQEIVDSSTHFGFTNVTTPCLGPTLTVCADPDHTLWWDAEHPSEFGHSAFAIMVETRISNY